jgi:xanthine/CO dehydrogenase XdhC/CoxF family maturation factor
MGTIAQKDLYSAIAAATRNGERVVLATVTGTRGSTPQQRGAKMLFFKTVKRRELSAAVA